MRKTKQNRLRRVLTAFMAVALLSTALMSSAGAIGVAAAEPSGQVTNILADENLINGVHYSEEDIVNYLGQEGHRLRVNHLTVTPGTENLQIISAKAQDTVNAMETVGGQAQREILKGNHVVAAINADSYDMDWGINSGIQVQNGNILVSQPNSSHTTTTPVFFVDESGKANIDPLRSVADIQVGEDYKAEVQYINRNQYCTGNDTRVFTYYLTRDHVMSYGAGGVSDQQAYALIRLNDFDGYIHAGTQYTGEVVQTYTESGFAIPSDCIVYAGYGTKAQEVAGLAVGEAVTYSCNLYTGTYAEADGVYTDRGTLCNEVYTAVNGFHLLAKDGVVNEDMVNNSGTDNNSRTVIGMTADGTMHVLCVAKPGTNFSESDGTSFKDITNYMMNQLGCVDVLNMDGGGSTEMLARRAGSDELVTVSYPSDGNSRSVSNSLLFVSTAPKSSTVGNVVVDENNIKLYPGSSYDFSVRLADTSGSSLSSEGKTIVWGAEKGTIDQNGHYTAPASCTTDTVTATVDGVVGTATIQVVDTFGSVGLDATGTVTLQQGDTRAFRLKAYDSANKEIYIDSSAAQWALTGDAIGTLEDGVLTVTASEGEADLTATFLGQTYSVHIIIGLKEQIIDDFEDSPIEGYYMSSYLYGRQTQYGGKSDMLGFETAEMEGSRVKNGENSFRVTYDTSMWAWDAANQKRTTNGTANFIPLWDDTSDYAGTGVWTEELRAQMEERYTAKAMPKKFGMWIYSGDENNDGVSDNINVMLTAVFKSACTGPGTGTDKSLNLVGSIDWIGWKYVEAEIPQDWPMTLVFNYFWFSNTNRALTPDQDYTTTLLFDDLKFIYTDEANDLSGPVFNETTPEGGGYYQDSMEFSTWISDSGSGVDASSITVTVNGIAKTDYTYDAQTGKLSFGLSGLEDGQSYRVIVKAKDNQGNESVPYIDNTYTVDLTPDTEGPTVHDVTPIGSVTVRIPQPRISFCMEDAKSGVDPQSIRVTLNGQEAPVYYDEETGDGYALPAEKLQKGSYVLTIDGKDVDGNAMATYTDTITIDPIAQPEDPENFKVSIIPDTQGNTYSDRIYSRAGEEESDFVIQMGDIVDGASQQEYTDGKNYIEATGKPYFVMAGNHEGVNGNLELFYQTFGSPTYHLEYGNTLFVFLNSAYGQSVQYTDSTQYHYLEQLLQANTLPNVVVLNHVVTRDDFATEHNMSASEAERFESILTAYKAENPDVNVDVLFGHLHTLHNWNVGDVDYIITGNAAGKGYVTAEEGNLLGSGIYQVTDGSAEYTYNPLLTRVYLQHDALIGDTLNTFEGATLQLNLYGDFREYPSNYITQLNSHELVNIQWSSSDPAVATVDEKGEVTVTGQGTATITAVCGGETAMMQLNVLDPSLADVASLQITLPEDLKADQTVLPTVTATDPYGVSFALDNQSVQFQFENGLAEMTQDGKIHLLQAGEETVQVTYQGRSAETTVQIGRSDADVVSIELSIPTGKVGDTVQPVVCATNPYGVQRTLDNQDVTFTVTNGLVRVNEDGTLTFLQAGAEVVAAEYNGLTAMAGLTIQEVEEETPSTPDPDEPATPDPDEPSATDPDVPGGTEDTTPSDENPSTGVSAMPVATVALLLLAALAVTGLAVRRKRNSEI